MARKHLFLTILSMVFLTILLFGCSSTPTLDPSIVWSDDFEDGDTEGWEDSVHIVGDEYFVSEGVLSFGDTTSTVDVGGDIEHPSTVTKGKWSFDAFFPEDKNKEISICFSCDKDWKFGFGMSTSGATNSMVSLIILDNFSVSTVGLVPLGRKLTGWNHFDVTRNDRGNSKIHLNGELILEYKDEITISSDLFYFDTTTIGQALDNVVVRNQVLEIQPVE